jgi:hypothetical protein
MKLIFYLELFHIKYFTITITLFHDFTFKYPVLHVWGTVNKFIYYTFFLDPKDEIDEYEDEEEGESGEDWDSQEVQTLYSFTLFLSHL